MQIEKIVLGTGASPKRGETVTVHYTGWLADGTKFDSSIDRGEPFAFALGTGQVIAGWDEGVATMRVGDKAGLRFHRSLRTVRQVTPERFLRTRR